jgi:2-oxoisovalerate dehydrogenase E1 component alpha subunit
MEYCRTERKPFMLEAMVSRLYGHSSSSGAQRVGGEQDCISLLEAKLLEAGVLDPETRDRIREEAESEVEVAVEQIVAEPRPAATDVEKYTYAPSSVDVVYPGDYTGLPAAEAP